MKKIIGLCISIMSLFFGINGVHAYYTINDMEDDQRNYGTINQREVYSITDNSRYGDYVVIGSEYIRTYYTPTKNNQFINVISHGIINLYDLNLYEQRKIVTRESYSDFIYQMERVSATYKDVPIMGKYTYYGSSFEIPFYNVWYYLLKGSNVYTKVEYEYRYVWSWFKLVRKKVAVTNYYAQNKYEKTIITGYKTVVDVPAHYDRVKVKKIFSPETVTYNKYIAGGSTNFGGFVEGLRKGAQMTADFFGEVYEAVITGDATQITFIKNGRKYFAKVLEKSRSAGDLYEIMITDLANNVVTTFNVAVDYYSKNPDEISELMGTLTFAYATGKLTDIGLSKINVNITPRMTSLFNKNKSMMTKLITNYGDDVIKYADNLGDDALNVLAKADDDVVELLVDNLDDYKNAADLANSLDEFKDVTGNVDKATFKSSYDIPKDSTTGYTKSNLRLGTNVHKEYKVGLPDNIKTFKEFPLYNGRRVDFVDFEKGIVYELKPNNPKAIKAGIEQAKEYIKELNRMGQLEIRYKINKEWTYVIDTY